MKTIHTKYDNTIIFGEAKEIKAVYKSMVRAWKDDRSTIMPLYKKLPTLIGVNDNEERKMYGIVIEEGDWYYGYTFKIINADIVLRSILDSGLCK